MRNIKRNALSLILTTMILASTIAVFHVSAVSTWEGYVKPPYPDYAPSGMPDFDEKQDNWGPAQGTYTWCVPVAVADSLWWLDSKYESKNYSTPVPPPTISDHFNLVTAYGQWDDHDPRNVAGLVVNLAALMHTDQGHVGTLWTDVAPGIQAYLNQQGVNSLFEVHQMDFPNFAWIDAQVTQCQDVELFLEFYYWTGNGWQPITYPSFESGHCVACAGSNATTNQVLVSDPWYDVSVPAANSAVHNDTQYVSHDPYNTAQFMFPWNPQPPPPYFAPAGYPPIVLELQNYLQITGFSQDPNWHAFIRGAVATSPLGVHDVAVTAVETFKTVCGKYFHPIDIVCENYSVSINATVENQGDFPETFDVTAKYDSTIIQTKSVSLAAHTSTYEAFTWDTHGVAKGSYNITVEAVLPTDSYPGDNKKTYGPVKVTWLGDLDGDFDVDEDDLWHFCGAFIDYYKIHVKDPLCDYNDDCHIDEDDLWCFCGAFIEYWKLH